MKKKKKNNIRNEEKTHHRQQQRENYENFFFLGFIYMLFLMFKYALLCASDVIFYNV